MLQPKRFKQRYEQLKFWTNLDFFASRLNCQLDKYVSYKSDPYAE